MSVPLMKTPPTDVAGFGPPASGSGLPLPADADIAAKKTGGCKTSTVELSDSPTLRRGGNSNQSMGAGLDPLDSAPGHYYHTDPVRPTSPRATPPDARGIGPPSTGHRAYSKLTGTLLATVAAAPVALAVRGFRGTASSPKTMGRVLVLLAMLSTASGWKLPSEPSVEPEMTIIGEEHESPITGGVARNRRRLASDCNSAWCVCPPRPCFSLVHVSVPLSSCPQRFNSTAAVMRVRHSRKRWWLRLRLCLGPFCGRWRLRLR